MASRRYRAKNSLTGNISNMDNRLHNIETRPAPRKIAANVITATHIQAQSITNEVIAPGGIDMSQIIPGAIGAAVLQDLIIDESKLLDSAVTALKLAANAVTQASIAANSVTSIAIATDAVGSLQIAANAVSSIELSSNAVTYGKVAANAIVGNNIQAGSVTGDRIIANTLYGNTVIANSLSGNTVVANTLSGNTVVANTLSGNTVVANTLSGNTVIANTLSGNTVIANTLSGNTVIANTLRGNTIIANTVSGNTIIANTLSGNTVVANTLYGNAIVAGSITGDRITGTTTIRLADSLLANPVNYIQFGHITLPGATSAGPGIMGAYSSTPSFYLGGFSSGGTSGGTGFSLGVYDNQSGTPVAYDILDAYITNAGGANPGSATSVGAGLLYLSGMGGSYSDPTGGGVSISTGWGDLSLNIGTAGTISGTGKYAKIRLAGPVQIDYASGSTFGLTNDDAAFMIGAASTARLKMSPSQIQAVTSTNTATSLYLNPNGGSIFAGFSGSTSFTTSGNIYGGSALYTMGVTTISGWQTNATDFAYVGGGSIFGTNTSAVVLGLTRKTSTGNIANFYYNSTTIAGHIDVTGTSSVSYVTSSDYRLKENIIDMQNAISRMLELRPVRFNWKDEPGRTVDGFIAHEVAPYVPEAITGEKDAVDEEGNPVYQGIDHSKLVPILTAALQEAIQRIEALEEKVASL